MEGVLESSKQQLPDGPTKDEIIKILKERAESSLAVLIGHPFIMLDNTGSDPKVSKTSTRVEVKTCFVNLDHEEDLPDPPKFWKAKYKLPVPKGI